MCGRLEVANCVDADHGRACGDANGETQAETLAMDLGGVDELADARGVDG